MIDEGYIKYNAHWKKTLPLEASNIKNINLWRQKMYDHRLIGAYPNGIGYGNISQRIGKTNRFIISGSKTGNFSVINENHYSNVKQIDINANELYCEGPIVASSESMSHAVIYEALENVNGVIHIHHLELWKQLLHRIPTTDKSALYGSPEIARSIQYLIKTSNLPEQKIFVMEGHEEGIFVFGYDLEEAASIILSYFS